MGVRPWSEGIPISHVCSPCSNGVENSLLGPEIERLRSRLAHHHSNFDVRLVERAPKVASRDSVGSKMDGRSDRNRKNLESNSVSVCL